MDVLSRIIDVINVEFPKVTTLWNNGEIRVNNFSPHLHTDNERLRKLANPASFSEIIVADGTLHWPLIQLPATFKGKDTLQALALDPDVLYQNSELIGISFQTLLSFNLRKARLNAGLSQRELAEKSGTTKAYISRLESGKADFQISTFARIIEQGLNKHHPQVQLG